MPEIAKNIPRATNRAAAMRRRQWGFGLLAVAAILVVWQSGALRVLELPTQDLRARWFDFASPGPSEKIALVAIDDQALRTVGRWPWPREQLGAVITEIGRAGAASINLDLLLDDPQSPRLVRSNGVGQLVEMHDDEVLAQAMTRIGTVVVGTGFKFAAARPAPSDADVETVVDVPIGRVISMLAADAALAASAESDEDGVIGELWKAVLPGTPPASAGPQHDEFLRKLRGARSLRRHAELWSIPVPPGDEHQWPTSTEPSPPVAEIAASASALANVTFDSFDSDGVTRRVPLWVRHADRLWPTLGLVAAMRAWGLDARALRIEGDRTIIRMADGQERSMHMHRARLAGGEKDGLHMVTWPRATAWRRPSGAPAVDWAWQFYNTDSQLPAEIAIGIAYEPTLLTQRARRNLSTLESLLRLACLRPDSTLIPAEMAASFGKLMPVMLGSELDSPEFLASLEGLRPIVARAAKESGDMAAFQLEDTSLAKLPKEDADKVMLWQQAANLLPQLLAEIETINSQLASVRQVLRQRLAGKVCFVGWTATGAAADFVPTSISPKTPGVHLHMAVANSVLTGFERRPGPAWLDAMAIIVLGVCGTWVGVRAGVVVAPVAAAGLIAGWFLIASIGLWDQGHIVAVIVHLGIALAGSCGVVLLHRLLVEQRTRRKTEERFKSYVSPKVVDILVNNPDLDSMKPQRRELSIMFTDLAGFTGVAEKLGSDRTADVMRHFLGPMTEILQTHNGTLDKYIGDAIMGFWGAPVENPSHAADACRTALDMQRTLDKLNADLAFGDGVSLTMRVGIASGELLVGDFGNPPRNSSYTVIGDTANLASRLEGANRAFGSRILVSQRTREILAATKADTFRWRTIGRVIVKGKSEPILLCELIGDLQPFGERSDQWILLSNRAVESYMSGSFSTALAAFDQLDTEFGRSPLSEIYREAISKESGPDGQPREGFGGSIVLTEK